MCESFQAKGSKASGGGGGRGELDFGGEVDLAGSAKGSGKELASENLVRSPLKVMGRMAISPARFFAMMSSASSGCSENPSKSMSLVLPAMVFAAIWCLPFGAQRYKGNP